MNPSGPDLFSQKAPTDRDKWDDALRSFAGIVSQLQGTNWNALASRIAERAARMGVRLAEEAGEVLAMSPQEQWELLLYGETALGRRFRGCAKTAVRREWRGLQDTAVDFCAWASLWGMLLRTLLREPLPLLRGARRYRWVLPYLCCHSCLDRQTAGLRGRALRQRHVLLHDQLRETAALLALLMRADEACGRDALLRKRVVLLDGMPLRLLMAGFPDLIGIPYLLLPVLLPPMLDQRACIPYLNAAAAYGLPADARPVSAAVAGACLADDLPQLGACALSAPCGAAGLASPYLRRRFSELPSFQLSLPAFYADEAELETGVQEIRHCIRFVEAQTGAQWNWDAYFSAARRFYEEAACALPQMSGRLRHRAIAWGAPALYYADFPIWLANCWGVHILAEIKPGDSLAPLETEDRQSALRDLARLFAGAGSCQDAALDGLWPQIDRWQPELVLLYQHAACQATPAQRREAEAAARARGVRLLWVTHGLLDPRTVSRRDMRRSVSRDLHKLLQEAPLDASLLEFDDEAAW